MRLFCVLYFLMVEKAESSYGSPLGCLIYGGAVLSCSLLIPRPRCPFLLSPSFSFPICVPVRLARRLVMSSRRASRLVRFVASCRSSCRLTCSSRRLVIRRPACRLVSHRSVLLFACSHSVCRGGLALRSHAVSFSPWRLVHRLVGSSRSFPVISFRLTRVRLVPVIMPCFRVRAVPSCSSLVLVRLFGPGLCPRSWGVAVRHGHVAAGIALLISSVPSWLLLATHSLRDGGGRMWGYVAPFRVCSPLVPLPAHAPSFSPSRRIPLALIAFSHPLIYEARKPGAEMEAKSDEDKTGTRKTTRRIETRRMTRWIKRDARRDEAGGDDTRGKQATRRKTRRRHETENEKPL